MIQHTKYETPIKTIRCAASPYSGQPKPVGGTKKYQMPNALKTKAQDATAQPPESRQHRRAGGRRHLQQHVGHRALQTLARH